MKYAIYYDATGYWDFIICKEYPIFNTEKEAWHYLNTKIINPDNRFLVFKVK